MYQALYRTYRPEIFSEVLGQEHIVRILKNQIAGDSTTHAYLFCGTRGTGKTTVARLLAKGLNCLSDGEKPCGECENCKAIQHGAFVDVVEIDAASNNGVENIRDVIETVAYPPAAGRKKVYIIDEVHMLSPGAFNALLKTLEEPPQNVVFILATTEPQKIPATILSRCVRFDFKRVPETILCGGMKKICEDLGINVSAEALRLIAANADGSVRDGLSLLDQCLAGGDKEISRDDVLELLGASGEEVFSEMADDIALGKTEQALVLLGRVISEGKDVKQFINGMLSYYRNLLLVKFVNNSEDLLNMSCENTERIKTQSDRFEVAEINDAIVEFAKTANEAKWSTQPRVLLELSIVKLASGGMLIQKALRRAEYEAEASEPKPVKEKTAAAAKKSPEKKESDNSRGEEAVIPGVDLSELWLEILEDKNAAGSLSVLKDGVELKRLDEKTFELECKTQTKMEFAEKRKDKLEELVKTHTGSHRTMVCRLAGKMQDAETGDTAENFESILGIPVSVK